MKNLTFCAFVAIMAILMWFVYGCGGTRNTDLSRTETKADKINIENSYSMGSKIVLANNYTFSPFDNLKPFYMNGQKYENVAITVDKGITKENYIRIKEKMIIHTSRNILTHKTTDKTNYIYLWLGLAFIICLFVFIWFYLPKFKTGI